MSHDTTTIPRFPPTLAAGLRFLPLVPLSMALTASARRITEAHPGLIRRIAPYDHTRFVLDPTDIPFVVCLEPNGGAPRVEIMRGRGTGAARIAGPLAALLGLVHGAYDGDALFFSRDLVIEGDTAAALALRNAVDDAELDFSDELAQLSGPLAAPLRRCVEMAQNLTGVSLSRPEELGAW